MVITAVAIIHVDFKKQNNFYSDKLSDEGSHN